MSPIREKASTPWRLGKPPTWWHQVLVQAPAARVFTVFTEGLGRWWPREYSWSRRVLDSSLIEPQAGGRCTERQADRYRQEMEQSGSRILQRFAAAVTPEGLGV